MTSSYVQSIRPAENTDTQELFGLIALCFAEYPGCVVDPHADLPDMLEPAHSFSVTGGAFWVIEDARGRVVACCGVDFPKTEVAELHRLYVRPDQRKAGLASRLLDKAESFARKKSVAAMILWSDTRFALAHDFYARRGYHRGDKIRMLKDISQSQEYFFEKRL